MKKEDLISLRDRLDSDYNFILATWLRGLRYGNSWFGDIEKEAYYQNYHKVIDAILINPKTEIKVACLKDDPEVILGYAVYNGNTLHWVFIKKDWRKIGIAKSLIPKTLQIVTHLTDIGKNLLKQKKPEVTFNPFIT